MKKYFLRNRCIRYQLSKGRMLVVLIPTFFIFGCAHSPAIAPKCSGVSFHSPTEIDACTGGGNAKVGDRIVFLKSKCSTPTRGNPKKCSNVKIGGGSVTKVLDEHLATIKLDSQFEVTEGTIVELEK